MVTGVVHGAVCPYTAVITDPVSVVIAPNRYRSRPGSPPVATVVSVRFGIAAVGVKVTAGKVIPVVDPPVRVTDWNHKVGDEVPSPLAGIVWVNAYESTGTYWALTVEYCCAVMEVSRTVEKNDGPLGNGLAHQALVGQYRS